MFKKTTVMIFLCSVFACAYLVSVTQPSPIRVGKFDAPQIPIVDISGTPVHGLFGGIRPSATIVDLMKTKLPVPGACDASASGFNNESSFRRFLRTMAVTSVNAQTQCFVSGCTGRRVRFQIMDCPASPTCSSGSWLIPFSDGNFPDYYGYKYNGDSTCGGCVCRMESCISGF